MTRRRTRTCSLVLHDVRMTKRWASDRLKKDRELAIEAVKISHKSIDMKEAIKAYGFALQWASLELQDDPEFASLAIEHSMGFSKA